MKHSIQSVSPREATFKDNILGYFSCHCIPVDQFTEFVSDAVIYWVKIRTVRRSMLLVNERGKVVGTPLVRFCIDLWLYTISLKSPMVPKHVIAKLESDWKHLSNVPIMIDSPFTKMTRGDTSLEHSPSQTITFCGNLRFCRTPSMSNILSSQKTESWSCLLFESLFVSR